MTSQEPLNKQFGIDPEKMRVIIKIILLHVQKRLADGVSLRVIEQELTNTLS